MRTLLAAILTLAACSSGSGGSMADDDGTDPTPLEEEGLTADARCDGPDPELPVTLRFGEMQLIDVDGMAGLYHVPPEPQAVLFFFHGSGGTAAEVDYLEQWRLYNRAHCHGVAVLAGSSIDEEWDLAMPASANPDVARIEALWAAVDATEGLPADLPVFVAGFSDGGGFAPRFADMMSEVGWDVRALALHNTFARYNPTVPAVFVSSEHDTSASPTAMRSRYEDTLARGLDAELFEWDEVPVTAERLMALESVDADDAAEIIDELERFGIIDASGERLFDVADVDPLLRTYQNNSEYRAPAKVARQLRVIWATHRFSGFAATEEMDFLSSYL